MHLHLSVFECVFFKDVKVITQRTCVVFPGSGRPGDDLARGPMAPRFLICWPHSSYEVVCPSSVSWLIPWILGVLRATGTWTASQINIMGLIDQLKFSQGADLEHTRSFSVLLTEVPVDLTPFIASNLNLCCPFLVQLSFRFFSNCWSTCL